MRAFRYTLVPLAIAGVLCQAGPGSLRPVSVVVPGHDSPQDAASRRRMLMGDEFGNVPIDGLTRAWAHVQQMRAAQIAREAVTPFAAGITRTSWTWLGPGNIGGRVRAVAVHPTTTSTIFIGSVSGGIWKSTNSGGTWAPVDDWMANLAVSSLVFEPGNPAVMYAGTGEGFYNFDRIQGAGIFKSVDGGTTWTQLASTANSNFLYVNRLAISPDATTILAGTSVGIYRSTNAGASWTKVLTVMSPLRADILDVKFIPGSNTNAVASGHSKNAYYSADGGVSWTAATGLVPGGTFNRVEIGVAPATPATVFLSVDHQYPTSPSGQIWRSLDSGVTYALVSTPGHLGSQGWYDNAIWVDPTNSTRLVAGGVSAYRSLDSGATFSQLTGIHSDHHAFVSDPGYNGTTNRRVYVGNDGGVYRNDDIITTSTFVSLNSHLGITQFYGAGGNTTSGKIIGGTQDNGTLLYNPANGTNAWTITFGGDGGYSAADPLDPNYLYGELQWGWLHRNTNGGVGSSYYIFGIMNGNICKPAPRCLTDAFNRTTNFIPPFILDPNNPNRLLAGGRSLWRSDDVKTPTDYVNPNSGPSWAAIKPPTSPISNINTIAVAPGNSDVVWVGHTNGDVFVTTDGTAASPVWTKVDGNATALPNRAVTRVVVDPTNSNIAYASFGGFSSNNVWRTADLGASWTQVTGAGAFALPSAPVYALAVHPTNTTWLYAGTEVGIFASTDSGASWSLPHDGPSNVSTDELFWMGTKLVAVTHGRGVYTSETVPAFGKTSPAAGAPGQPVSVLFSWTANVGATGYEFCIDTVNNGSCDATWDPVGTVTSVQVGGLNGATTYYWHVRSNLAYSDGSDSAFWSFTTGALPGAFSKTAPANGATSQATGLLLSWGASAGATSYEFCLDTVNNNSCDGTWDSTGTDTSVAVGGLNLATTYYWHVRALNAIGETYSQGSSTAFWSFTTRIPPFGQVDTPAQDASGVQGAIAVTGWALDNVGVTTVQIFRNCLAFEPANCQTVLGHSVVYVGDAAFLDGARPDVEAAHPGYPNNTRAGWGYLMLTPLLPHVTNSQPYGGQGPLTLYAVATDQEGNKTLLGRSSNPADASFATPTAIALANDSIAKPFGAIDIPPQGYTFGGPIPNYGWALTPDTNTNGGEVGDIVIPTDGSTITVFIDSLPVSVVAYNQCRGSVGNPVPAGVYCDDDVASIFGHPTPQPNGTPRTSNPTLFRNLDAGRASIALGTIHGETLSNGLHTLAWSVTDSAGRTEGIGSRYFTVANGAVSPLVRERGQAALAQHARATDRVWGRTGFDLAAQWQTMRAREDGTFAVRLPEMGRLELWLGEPIDAGYLVANGQLHPLPMGSMLKGPQFGWMPPPGYTGPYALAFVRGGERVDVTVTVVETPRVVDGEAQIRMGVLGAQVLSCSGAAAQRCVRIEGSAHDPQAAIGSGIGAVHVWAVRHGATAPVFLGAATLDEAAFSLTATLAPGSHTMTAYVWSVRTARWEDARRVQIVVR